MSFFTGATRPIRARRVRRWAKDQKKRKVRRFAFPDEVCLSCPRHQECLGERKKGRRILLHYHEPHLIAARQRQQTVELQVTYRIRPKVERKLAELVDHGLRQARYIGREKKELQALWTGAAVNFKRLFKLAKGDTRSLRNAIGGLLAQRGQTMPFFRRDSLV